MQFYKKAILFGAPYNGSNSMNYTDADFIITYAKY